MKDMGQSAHGRLTSNANSATEKRKRWGILVIFGRLLCYFCVVFGWQEVINIWCRWSIYLCCWGWLLYCFYCSLLLLEAIWLLGCVIAGGFCGFCLQRLWQWPCYFVTNIVIWKKLCVMEVCYGSNVWICCDFSSFMYIMSSISNYKQQD